MTRRLGAGTAAASTAVALVLSLSACGQGDAAAASAAADAKIIGLLLPDRGSSTRYDDFDYPLISSSVTGLCTKCTVDYANANGDTPTQKQQFDAMVAKGEKVILLDPVNATVTAPWIAAAARKGVKVVSYDRLASGSPVAYVSFDNERTGELQGQALLQALGSKADGAQIVMIDGAETDPNAAQFKAGAHHILDGKVKIGYEQSGEWKADVATQKITEAIGSLGRGNVQAVYSANDGMAAAIISTLHSDGLTNVPVGGQDASLSAIQRILAGQQAYTIYKPFKPETDTAASIAVYLLDGLDVTGVARSTTDDHGIQIPSVLLTPVVVTKDTVDETVIAGGLYKTSDICTGQYVEACQSAGIK